MSPKGARSRRPPASSPRQRVFIIRPEKQSPENRRLLGEAYQRAQALGITPTVYMAKRLAFRGESPETSGEVLTASDAATIYQVAHRDHVLVMAGARLGVILDPSSTPPTRRGTVELRRYVAHKALYASIEDRADIATALATLGAWPASLGCNGESDPRVLPLHVFQTNRDWSQLDDPDVAKSFARRYGAGSRRVDDGGKNWQRTKEYHGADRLHVGGVAIEEGLHWDVSCPDGSASVRTVDAVWRLSGRFGYVNVSPDGRIGNSKGRSTAKRVWPR